MKQATKTWIAKGVFMFAYRTGMASSCNKACNTDKKALFSVFCDL